MSLWRSFSSLTESSLCSCSSEAYWVVSFMRENRDTLPYFRPITGDLCSWYRGCRVYLQILTDQNKNQFSSITTILQWIFWQSHHTALTSTPILKRWYRRLGTSQFLDWKIGMELPTFIKWNLFGFDGK